MTDRAVRIIAEECSTWKQLAASGGAHANRPTGGDGRFVVYKRAEKGSSERIAAVAGFFFAVERGVRI